MSLPQFSAARPVLTAMVTMIVVVIGLFGLDRLQIDLLPKVEMPTLTIMTDYEGASPEVIEQRVTQVIEEIVGTVPGVEEITSESSEGSSRVRVTFGWGTSIDTVAVDVRSRLEDEMDELPETIVRPRIRTFDISSFPVVILGVSSRLDPVELTTLVEEQIRHRFAQIPGVAQVDPWGSYEREVRVELDRDRLRALQLPLDSIVDAVRNANVDLPAGRLEQGSNSVVLRAPAQFDSLAQIGETIVAQRNGASIRLDQIATIHDTYRKLEQLARVNGELGLRIAIRKQSDANTVEVAQRILREIEATNAAFPQIEILPVINQGNFIERSIANVTQSVLYGGGLAVLVLLFFLRDLRSTAVIAVAVPISLLATFALLFFGGFSLNLMTLGGLALGVGMMVDNSIVVLENIFRRRDELGESTREAAVQGAREVGPAIVASTITTLVIFLPLAFVRGVSGVLFRDLAFVIVLSLSCSLLVSLSLVPMLASRLLSGPGPGSAEVGSRDLGYGGLVSWYERRLGWALAHRALTVAVAAVALAASLLLVPKIGTEFLPPSDEGEVRVSGEMAIGTKLDLVDRQTRWLESLVYPAVPEAVASVVSVGASGYSPGNAAVGEIRLTLLPATQRARSNVDIANDLREQLAGEVPGMEIRTRAPQGQFLLERILGGDEGLTIEVRGFDLEQLDALAKDAAAVATEISGITDVKVSREAGVPQHEIHTDRDKAADMGLSPRDVARALEAAIAGTPAGEYRVGGNSYRILVQLENAEQLSIDDVLDLTVASPSGPAIALRNVVTAEPSRGPSLIERHDQRRTVSITANVAGRDLGSVAAELDARLSERPRPAGYEVRLRGKFEEQQKAFDELMLALAMALALVYMVLAAQYESLRDPLVVMLAVPVAAIGVVLTLVATDTTLNIQSFIGCIMLGGIVVNNAILLVDQARRQRLEGIPTLQAAKEAGRRRLRPILMTTLTTVLALLPLAVGVGEGADAQAPLARAVLGGLAASTLITLVVVPAVYSLVHRDGA